MWVKTKAYEYEIWQVDKWQQYDWLIHGFTTNEWGNLALHINDDACEVVRRRERLSQSLTVSLDQWVVGNQIHQTRIASVNKAHQGFGARTMDTALVDTDGMVTKDKELLLVSFYADCVPLLFVEPYQKLIGMVHAGWRGTVAKISVAMAEQFNILYQIEPKDLEVAIGPSIGSCCYQVGNQVADNFEPEVVSKTSNGLYLDLKKSNRLQLEQYGIKSQNIFESEVCTCCNAQFFSYRREGERSGRMGSFLGKGFQ